MHKILSDKNDNWNSIGKWWHELYVFFSVQNLGKNRLAIENNI
jgi:hypothetical protein